MGVLGVIITRKGSKRLPKKNVRILNGKPLIEWSIDCALESGLIDKLIIGTDDFEVMEICRKKEIKYIILPKYLTCDYARSEESILYILSKIKKHDYIMLLQTTSPVRDKNDIKNILEIENKKKNDNPVCSINKSTGKLNGSIYLIKWDKLIETRNLCRDRDHNNIYESYPMSINKSIDIDTIEDFQKAEELLKELNDR